MQIGILKEFNSYEKRVAITPEVAAKLKQLNFTVAVEEAAGEKAGFSNQSYEQSGSTITTREQILKEVNIIVSVNAITKADLPLLKARQILIGNYSVFSNKELVEELAAKGVELLSLELMPRISRAQAMDILSSQNNLAGYKAVLVAADCFKKAFPLMMTAAGMIPPAKVFIMGTGVAGLQAIATAKRLGAVVSAYDVRAATREQVESLGAKFVVVDESVFKDSESATGYAKELPKDYQEKEKEVILGHIIKQDIVITTALIPGKKAPLLVNEQMVKGMANGSIIVDLAASNGGNCELTEANKIVEKHGVTIIGNANLASDLATSASNLLSNNLFSLFKAFYQKEQPFSFNYTDDIIKNILVTKDGAIVNQLLNKS